MEVISERRFTSNFHLALKKRLDSLHYSQPLSLESTALVEKLLNDILKTTEGFQKLKKTNQDIKSQLELAKDSVAPLEREVNRLSKQNNDLHLELMSIKEDTASREDNWRASVRSLEGEISDLKFLLENSRNEIKRHEKVNFDLRTKLDNTLKKTQLASEQRGLKNATGPATNIRAQAFELTRALGESEAPDQSIQRTHSVWAEELQAADSRANLYQEKYEDLVQQYNAQTQEINQLKGYIKNREFEINRLSILLGEGVNMKAMAARYKDETKDSSVKLLNERIDFLNRQNVKLEDELGEARGSVQRISGLLNENANLQETLAASRVQNQKLTARVNELQKVGKRLQSESTSVSQYKQVKKQLDFANGENQKLRAEIKRLNGSKAKNEALQATFQTDKKAFTEALEGFQVENSELHKQLTKAQDIIQDLEIELHRLQQENQTLNIQINNLSNESSVFQEKLKSQFNKTQESTEELYSYKQQINLLKSENAQLQNEIHNLQFELERANKTKEAIEFNSEQISRELNRLQIELESSNNNRQRNQITLESSQLELASAKDEISQLQKLREQDKREIDANHDRIRQLEDQIFRAQSQISSLQSEKLEIIQLSDKEKENIRRQLDKADELKHKSDQIRHLEDCVKRYQDDLKQLKEYSVKYHESASQSNILHRTLADKDNKISDLNREIDELRNRVEYYNTQLRDAEQYQQELKQQITDSYNSKMELIRQNDAEKESIRRSLNRDSEIYEQQQQIQQLRSNIIHLENSVNELNRYKMQYNEAEAENRSLESVIEDKEYALQQAGSDIESLQFKIRDLQIQLKSSESKVQELQQNNVEIANSRKSETEGLRATLENETKRGKRNAEQLNTEIMNLKAELSMAQDKIRQLTREKDEALSKLKAANAELSQSQKSYSTSQENYQSLYREKQNLQEDLLKAQEKLNRSKHQQSSLQSEIADLKPYIQKYNDLASELLPLNTQIEELQFSIKKLKQDKENLELQLQSSISENSNLKSQLEQHLSSTSEQKDEISHLYRRITSLTNELEHLEQKSQNSQSALEALQKENQSLQYSTRAAEMKKEEILRKHEYADSELKLTDSKLQTMQSEIRQLTHDLTYEKQRTSELEALLKRERVEKENLRREVTQVDEMREATQRELSIYQLRQSGDLSSKVEEQRTEILNLEMERMRLQDELSKYKYELSRR